MVSENERVASIPAKSSPERSSRRWTRSERPSF